MMLIFRHILFSVFVITPVFCFFDGPTTLEEFAEEHQVTGFISFDTDKYHSKKPRPVPYKVRDLTPIAKFIDEYFSENPGLNGTESLYKVFNMTYSVCNYTVVNRDVSDRVRALCRKHLDDVSDLIMDKYDRFLDSDNVEYNIQKEYLGYKLKNWGNPLESLIFKNSFCNLSEKEDLEELNYHLIQIVCSVIKKNDTEFVKKLPQLIPEDDETRLHWIGKAEKAIQRMEKYFQQKLKSPEEIKVAKKLKEQKYMKLAYIWSQKVFMAMIASQLGTLPDQFTCRMTEINLSEL